MAWALETVLPQEVRKLASVINDDLQNHGYQNVALQAKKDVYQAELQKCQETITHLKYVM